jgi:NAD(P)-dependent dehydrogenase (short-subunit alcohol dehydrogenase family)
MGQLDGRIAIVTGSDFGIGRGIAEELVREDADIAITYLVSSDADYVTGQNFTIDGGLETNWDHGA